MRSNVFVQDSMQFHVVSKKQTILGYDNYVCECIRLRRVYCKYGEVYKDLAVFRQC